VSDWRCGFDVDSMILRKLRTLRSFGWSGTYLIAEATLLTVVIPVGFRLVGVGPTQAGLRRWASIPRTQQGSENLQTVTLAARRARWMVQSISGFKGSCLTRSLVLWTLLRRRGVDSDLRVGFRRREQRLEGHAWVEYEGVPLNEDPTVVQTYSVSEKSTTFDFQ